jgi:hypothetical protein
VRWRAFLYAGLSFAQAGEHAQHHQKNHRADKGVDDGSDKAGAEADMEIGEQKTGDYGADDADRDVAKKPEAAAPDDLAGEPAGNGTNNQPNNNALYRLLIVHRRLHPSA